MFKGKKGSIGTAMTLGVATIIILVIIIIFILITGFVTSGISKNLAENAERLKFGEEAHQSLAAYLKTPVQVDINNIRQEITMSDMIRLTQISGDSKETYSKILELKSREIFDKTYDVYVLLVGEDFGIERGPFKRINVNESISLPLDREKNVMVKLVLGI